MTKVKSAPMDRERLVIRRYTAKDYTDILESGYPFTSYLKPSLLSRIRNVLNAKEMQKIVIRTLLLNQEETILVAFSKEENKAVAAITLRKITEDLWGIWNVFVSPSYRGRRIASSLYQKSFKLLEQKYAKKAVGVVRVDNTASVKSIERNWQGFLGKRILSCSMNTRAVYRQIRHRTMTRTMMRGEKRSLFKIYGQCVGEEWCSLLEIDPDSFTSRIFGVGFFEPIGKNLATRLLIKSHVRVAESEGGILGYGIYRTTRFLTNYSYFNLYVSSSKDFDDICSSLLYDALDESNRDGKDQLTLVFIGNSRMKKLLAELGLEPRESLVAYRCL